MDLFVADKMSLYVQTCTGKSRQEIAQMYGTLETCENPQET